VYNQAYVQFGWDFLRALRDRKFFKLAETLSRCIGEEPKEAVQECARSEPSQDELTHASLSFETGIDPNHWFGLLCLNWIKNGFWAGSLTQGGEPSAVFQCNGPCTIFTSTDIDLDCSEEPLFSYNHVVLEVEETLEGGKSEIRALRYNGKSAGGLWYGSKIHRHCIYFHGLLAKGLPTDIVKHYVIPIIINIPW